MCIRDSPQTQNNEYAPQNSGGALQELANHSTSITANNYMERPTAAFSKQGRDQELENSILNQYGRDRDRERDEMRGSSSYGNWRAQKEQQQSDGEDNQAEFIMWPSKNNSGSGVNRANSNNSWQKEQQQPPAATKQPSFSRRAFQEDDYD